MMYESMNPSSPPLQHDTWMSLFSTVLLVSVITLLHTKITTTKKKNLEIKPYAEQLC
jgi:ribosomal protein L17